ncbi:hypothetical protein AB0F72_00980 [Actinoplanes sp. NPDC023936]|uniref:hypothetical protein n=1 Tax=Actinoplanes sp. NPDC023936 TaxID=3154910 RepID=UPI0033DB02D2
MIESIAAVGTGVALHYAALVHADLQQWETAVQVTTRALQTPGLPIAAPIRPWILRTRVRAYRELGDLAAARADLEAVREIKKVDGDASGLREVEEELRALS